MLYGPLNNASFARVTFLTLHGKSFAWASLSISKYAHIFSIVEGCHYILDFIVDFFLSICVSENSVKLKICLFTMILLSQSKLPMIDELKSFSYWIFAHAYAGVIFLRLKTCNTWRANKFGAFFTQIYFLNLLLWWKQWSNSAKDPDITFQFKFRIVKGFDNLLCFSKISFMESIILYQSCRCLLELLLICYCFFTSLLKATQKIIFLIFHPQFFLYSFFDTFLLILCKRNRLTCLFYWFIETLRLLCNLLLALSSWHQGCQ